MTRKIGMPGPWLALLAAAMLLLSGCGYNTLQSSDEQVKAGWSEVLNQYQRRADLVPNLVETVKAFAKQEQEVFTRVTEARSHQPLAGKPLGTIGCGMRRAVGRARDSSARLRGM